MVFAAVHAALPNADVRVDGEYWGANRTTLTLMDPALS